MSPATIATLVQTVIAELEPVVATIENKNVSQTTQQKVTQALADIRTAAGTLATTEATSSGLPLLERIFADAQAILAVAATLPLPPQIATGMLVAQTLLPMLLGLAHTIWPKA